MGLKYVYIKKFLKSNIELRKGDYIYKHDKNVHPLKNEYDLAKLYYVTSSVGHKLSTMNMTDTTNVSVDLNNTSEHWWIMRIPSFFRKQIGLEQTVYNNVYSS